VPYATGQRTTKGHIQLIYDSVAKKLH
jgi:hypothetical protein